MTAKAKADIAETRATISEIQEDLAELEEEFREEADEIGRKWEEALDEIEETKITPRRADVGVQLFALAWAPYWRIAYTAGGREHVRTVPAYTED
jgi:hypothetical protein